MESVATVATLPIEKLDTERRIAFGWASVGVRKDGQAIEDTQGDVIDAAALGDMEAAVYGFMRDSRDGGEMHAKRGIGRVVESLFVTPEKLQKMGLAPDAMPQGWWLGVQVDDESAWQGVKSGKYSMFSIGGRGVREDL